MPQKEEVLNSLMFDVQCWRLFKELGSPSFLVLKIPGFGAGWFFFLLKPGSGSSFSKKPPEPNPLKRMQTVIEYILGSQMKIYLFGWFIIYFAAKTESCNFCCRIA
jgi:hypothetical protein